VLILCHPLYIYNYNHFYLNFNQYFTETIPTRSGIKVPISPNEPEISFRLIRRDFTFRVSFVSRNEWMLVFTLSSYKMKSLVAVHILFSINIFAYLSIQVKIPVVILKIFHKDFYQALDHPI